MNAILNHIRGQSRAVDRVWAQVSGLASSRAGDRAFMVLQAFIDDSYEPEAGAYVLAGYVASAERWAAFSREWELALPKWGRLNEKGRFHFKMSEMSGRMSNVAGMYRIIEDHVDLAVSIAFIKEDFHIARARLYLIDGRGLDWDEVGYNYYMFAFYCLMDTFHTAHTQELKTLIPENERVDFYFDDQREKGQILRTWDRYMDARPPEIRDTFGRTPRFEDDSDFLPLQAADFWAWWIREWNTSGEAGPDMNYVEFKHWRADPTKPPRLQIRPLQDGIVEVFVRLIKAAAPEAIIVDLKHFAVSADFSIEALKASPLSSASNSRAACLNRSDCSF